MLSVVEPAQESVKALVMAHKINFSVARLSRDA